MAPDTFVDQLVQIVRDVRAGEDVPGAAQRICAAAVEVLGGEAEAGLLLAHRRTRVENVESLGATGEVVVRGEQLQIELEEGPCLDAMWEKEQVLTGDLEHEARWPRWGRQMVQEHGLRSMLCTRLFTNERQLGALNVYSTERDAFDEQDVENVRLLGVHAAMAVTAAQQVQGLNLALDRRTTIGQALGMIMLQYDLDEATAFSVLQRLSSHENRKLFDIAQEIVLHRAALHAVGAAAGAQARHQP